MQRFGNLKKMMDVSSGRKKASLVLKHGTIVNVFTEKTEVADIAIEDGYIAGIGEYDGEENVDMTASILAKTYRDDYMNELHKEYPFYDWNSNKGYPNKVVYENL